ncbi:MAG: hypothetical protein K6A44_04395 [bacterium]|nr:hypothetical protein [bacterium]
MSDRINKIKEEPVDFRVRIIMIFIAILPFVIPLFGVAELSRVYLYKDVTANISVYDSYCTYRTHHYHSLSTKQSGKKYFLKYKVDGIEYEHKTRCMNPYLIKNVTPSDSLIYDSTPKNTINIKYNPFYPKDIILEPEDTIALGIISIALGLLLICYTYYNKISPFLEKIHITPQLLTKIYIGICITIVCILIAAYIYVLLGNTLF